LSGPNGYFSSLYNVLDMIMHVSFWTIVIVHCYIVFVLADVSCWLCRAMFAHSQRCAEFEAVDQRSLRAALQDRVVVPLRNQPHLAQCALVYLYS